MLLHSNIEELISLAKNFYDITHTMLSVYDVNKQNICSYPKKSSVFCTEIRKSKELTEKCYECDRKALEICEKTRNIYSYNCHMGLIEVAVPIIQNDIIIGYLLFGQITDKKDKTSLLFGLEDFAKEYNINYETLKTGINKIKYRSSEYISSISKIVEMCANYIWLNSIMSIRNDSSAHAIDIYIRENLDKNLNVENICHQFHISRSALYSLSKKYFGYGITEYISLCRLSAAKELLKSGEFTVAQTASKIGFDDVTYFIKFFKKHTNLTPKKYQLSKISK